MTIAVLPAAAPALTRIDKYPNDFAKRRRVCERHAQVGQIRACYEASGAGYVLQRAMQAWGYHGDVIAALALTPADASAVATLQCFRSVQVHGAMVLATERVDWRGVASPRQRMAYLGFVPREHSSGERERRGSITRAGNAHCRHVLVQAAWAYRLHPKVGPALVIRQRG